MLVNSDDEKVRCKMECYILHKFLKSQRQGFEKLSSNSFL